jgi:hypothetical protein
VICVAKKNWLHNASKAKNVERKDDYAVKCRPAMAITAVLGSKTYWVLGWRFILLLNQKWSTNIKIAYVSGKLDMRRNSPS